MPRIRPVPISKLQESRVDLEQECKSLQFESCSVSERADIVKEVFHQIHNNLIPAEELDNAKKWLMNANLNLPPDQKLSGLRNQNPKMRCDVCDMEFETDEKFNQHFQTIGHRALAAVKCSNRSHYIHHRPKQRPFNVGAVQENVSEKRSKSTNDFNKDLYCIDDDMEICQSGN